MNFREGSRRLALFVGVIGAIACCYYSWIFAMDALDQHHRYKEFSRLAALPIVREADESRKRAITTLLAGLTIDDDSTIDRDGIHLIVWDRDGKIEWIDPIGAENVRAQTEGAPFCECCAIFMMPIFGFFIPWLAVRAITWVLIGFTKSTE